MQERRLLIVIFGDESNCSGVVSMHKLVCFIAMAYNMIDAVSTELYRVVNFSTSAHLYSICYINGVQTVRTYDTSDLKKLKRTGPSGAGCNYRRLPKACRRLPKATEGSVITEGYRSAICNYRRPPKATEGLTTLRYAQ